jgi:hypothetical protein
MYVCMYVCGTLRKNKVGYSVIHLLKLLRSHKFTGVTLCMCEYKKQNHFQDPIFMIGHNFYFTNVKSGMHGD